MQAVVAANARAEELTDFAARTKVRVTVFKNGVKEGGKGELSSKVLGFI